MLQSIEQTFGYSKKQTIAFTGNRELTTPNGHIDRNLENVIRTELHFILEDCYKEGFRYFLSGMAWGFDLMAAQAVLDLKEQYPDIKLIAVIPFENQEGKFSDANKILYCNVLNSADNQIIINSTGYSNAAYHKRNDYLIDNASEIIAYCNTDIKTTRGKGHGALTTIKKAEDKGLFVMNLYQELADYFSLKSQVKQYLQRYTHIKSFRYNSKGLVFKGDNRPHFLYFEEISEVTLNGMFLEFLVDNGVTYQASIWNEECFVQAPAKVHN